ncbi:MAG: zinc ribbon domain-containing protein [Candidatus Lokiarchaeota archaeon]|nr:zinc ribbon domain-containing protein [Candidatus Lokiarchaeota archaeon]
MHYCQNCGTKIESKENFCTFCGIKFEETPSSNEKDARIEELEQNLSILEQKQRTKSRVPSFSPWIAIVPIAFVAVFFGFFILLIWIIRQ